MASETKVFAHHRPQPSAPVAIAAERGGARTLELNVAPLPLRVDYFAQKMRPPVSQLWRPAAKLMARIDHGQRIRPFGAPVTGQNGQPLVAGQRLRIQPQLFGQPVVERN